MPVEDEINNATPPHPEHSIRSNGHQESQAKFNTINDAYQTVNNENQKINNELQKLQHLPAVQVSVEILAELRLIKARLTSVERV